MFTSYTTSYRRVMKNLVKNIKSISNIIDKHTHNTVAIRITSSEWLLKLESFRCNECVPTSRNYFKFIFQALGEFIREEVKEM